MFLTLRNAADDLIIMNRMSFKVFNHLIGCNCLKFVHEALLSYKRLIKHSLRTYKDETALIKTIVPVI